SMDELHDRGWRFALAEARRVVQDGPAYLSFDIDALDPAFAPGTGTPEAGGLSVIEAQRILRGLAGIDIVAADLVEVAPPFDHAGLTAFNAASLLFEILCLLAEARLRRASAEPRP
ncbi:MAG: arginase family protein, partial [Alphaproteobacteria bacterium]|nr:arginase family protein [Alphaproteobacteria bacterium]